MSDTQVKEKKFYSGSQLSRFQSVVDRSKTETARERKAAQSMAVREQRESKSKSLVARIHVSGSGFQ